MDEAALLEGLDGAQREAVLTDASPLVILAPAGSGKTRVVSHRIARRVLDGSADAQHVLAITFTRRAAGELQRRLGRLGLRGRPTAGTFHGVAWAVLTQRWSDQRRARPELLTDRARLLETVVGQLVPTRRVASVRVEAVASELDWARARLVPPDRYAEEARRGGRRPPLPPDLLAEVFSAYADREAQASRASTSTTCSSCARRELEHQPDFAASQRWRFRHLFVDEFQDVNPLQFRLLEAWRGGRPDLCVVGDPNQAIYGWNGADPSLLLPAPLAGGWRDGRATRPQLPVDAAGAHHRGGPAPPRRGPGRGAGRRSRSPRCTASPPSTTRPAPSPRCWPSAGRAGGGRRARSWSAPGPRWAPSSAPCATPRSRYGSGTTDRCSTFPVCRRRCAKATSAEPLGNVLEELEHRLATGAAEAAPGEAEPAGLRQLCSLGRELLSASPSATLGTFRAWLAAGGADVADGADAVDVLTFHAAKGLEWPLVVVAGVEAGLVPHHSATGVEGRAEETRLLYVALTRAEHELHCTWARSRGRDGRRERKPSPLLELVRVAAMPPPAAPPPWDRQPAAAGDPPVLTALRQWRRPLGPGGRRPRARGLLRRPALGPRDGPSDHRRRAGRRPRAGGRPAAGPPPAPRAGGGQRVALSPTRSLARLHQADEDLRIDRHEQGLGLRGQGVAVVEGGRGVELAAVDPVDPPVEPELAVQRRGLAVADRQQTGHPDQAGERHGEAEHLVEGGRHEPAVDAARRALVGVAEHDVTHDVLVGDAEHDGWRQRVGRADQRAELEEGPLVPGHRRLGEAFVGPARRHAR